MRERTNFEKSITTTVKRINPTSQNVESFIKPSKRIRRLYFPLICICNDKGFQISPNVVRLGSGWNIEKAAIGKNWSCASIFSIKYINQRRTQKAIFSSIYSDIRHR